MLLVQKFLPVKVCCDNSQALIMRQKVCFKQQLATSLLTTCNRLVVNNCRLPCKRILISACRNKLLQHVDRLVANLAVLAV